MKELTPRRYDRLKKELAANGKIICTVASGSMLPLLPIGCEIEVVPLRGVPRVFDIVVFLSADRLICHYVLHVNRLKETDPVLVTRGLAPCYEDIPIRRSAVLGRVANQRIPLRSKMRLLAAGLIRLIRRV